MAIFCSVIASLFCLHTSYPADPQISVMSSTNGLFSVVQVQGKGWTAEQLISDMIIGFNPKMPGIKRACVEEVCVDFRRNCQEADGKVSCRYDINTGAVSTISVTADNPEAMQRAAHSIALSRVEKRESDFPLTLLNEAADKP